MPAQRKFNRDEWKDELIRRGQESEDRKSGFAEGKYFRDDANLKFVKFEPTKDKPHIIDIIPFVCGDKMPDFMHLAAGRPAYYVDLYVHEKIGPGKVYIVCPARNYGEPCPICEHIDGLVDDGKEWEDYQSIAPKRRCIYNIVDMTTVAEQKKGIQIWEVSYKYSEKLIQTAARNPKGGGSIPFAHWDKEIGQSLTFSVDKDKYRTMSGHRFIPRDYNISEDILNAAHQLDQIITLLSYKEINGIFVRRGEEAAASSDVPNYSPDDTTTADESRQVADTERTQATGNSNQCPSGGNFGVDIDKIKACDTCDAYAECSEYATQLEEDLKKNKAEAARAARRKRQ